MQRSVWFGERVAAFLFYFKKVSWNDRIDAALTESAAVDAAGVNVSGRVVGLLNQERAANENLAAGSASGAFALAPREQFLVLGRVDIRPEEAARFPYSLPYPKSDASLPAPLVGGARQTTAGER
jgi:hypothetical protein